MDIRYQERDLRKARFFSNPFSFVEDMCAIYDHLEFGRNFKNIYPLELKFKKEKISSSEVSFLDLCFILENKKFKTRLYDKGRDVFYFSDVHMLYLDSNNLSNIYYASIGSEIFNVC